MLMVKAGKPVDDFIELLIPLLDKGDIIIEGATLIFLTLSGELPMLKAKVSFISAQEFQEVKKARCSALR